MQRRAPAASPGVVVSVELTNIDGTRQSFLIMPGEARAVTLVGFEHGPHGACVVHTSVTIRAATR